MYILLSFISGCFALRTANFLLIILLNTWTYAIVTMPGWCRILIALLLRVELVSVQAPYKKICQLRPFLKCIGMAANDIFFLGCACTVIDSEGNNKTGSCPVPSNLRNYSLSKVYLLALKSLRDDLRYIEGGSKRGINFYR